MRVPDIPMLLNEGNSFRSTAVVRLRSFLDSANEDEYQPYLWSKDNNDEWCDDSMTGCFHGQNDRTLNQLSRAVYHETDSRLWMTPLTSDFSSGVFPEPQFAPRVNTTVTYTNITAGEWPSECAREKEATFFAEYSKQLEYPRVGLVICMPTNISSSPWDATHNRQDITEELYLNISTHPSGKSFYKATAKTSLGYFEIPSAHNGFIAGPLLDQVILPNLVKYSRRTQNLERREINDTYVGNITQELGSNIGPLTTVALALFGEGSFIDTRLRNPSAYVIRERPDTGTTDNGTYTDEGYSYNCMSSTPLAFLSETPGMGCWDDRQLSYERGVIFQVERFISLFAEEARIQAALTTGAFLANKAWLAPDGSSRLRQDISRTILVDHGVSTIKTSLSMAGIIAGSVLLGAHLLGLLALALYAFVQKPFVPWLGAEVMVKAGIAYAEVLGASEGEEQWINAAAACKGFVGDEKAGSEVGRMAFGAPTGLTTKKDRKFEGL